MTKQTQVKQWVLSLALALAAAPMAVWADDVENSIKEGLESYKDGEFKDAVESLNYASQLIQQMKGQNLESLLPAPLAGWKAEDSKSASAGSAMFGGGVSAERTYLKGRSRVGITIITDSPMMQGMMMMFSNPMFATSDGGKLTKIKREKAIVKYNAADKSGEIQVVVDNRILVTIDGSDVSEDTLMDFAKAVDFKKLEDNF